MRRHQLLQTNHAHEGRAGVSRGAGRAGGGMGTDRARVVLELAQVDRLVPFREAFALREARACSQLLSKCAKRSSGRRESCGPTGRHPSIMIISRLLYIALLGYRPFAKPQIFVRYEILPSNPLLFTMRPGPSKPGLRSSLIDNSPETA